MENLKGNGEIEENDSASNERMVRYALRHERMLFRAGIRSELKGLGKWYRFCNHSKSSRRKRMNYLIMRSPILPYSDTTISQHLSRTQRWMRNPGRSSLYCGIAAIKKVSFCLQHSSFLIFSLLFSYLNCMMKKESIYF